MCVSAFSITTPRGTVLLVDPWLNNPSNPEAKDGRDPLASLPKVDYILITHGHYEETYEKRDGRWVFTSRGEKFFFTKRSAGSELPVDPDAN